MLGDHFALYGSIGEGVVWKAGFIEIANATKIEFCG